MAVLECVSRGYGGGAIVYFANRLTALSNSLTIVLPKEGDIAAWSQQILAIAGVDEMVMMPKEGIAYLKLDKAQLTENTRQDLSRLTGQTLAI